MIEVDRSVPALLVRTGQPMWDYGALATVRSLGRLGVDVYVLALPDERELLTSRFLKAVIGEPVNPTAQPRLQAEQLNSAVATIGQPCVAIAGDDESAVLIAEQRENLDSRLLSAAISASLPRSLSDKVSLGTLAAQVNVPYPPFIETDNVELLNDFVGRVGPPWVLKSPAPYARLSDQTVTRTVVVHDRADLEPWVEQARHGNRIFVQKYLRTVDSQTWYAAGVSTRDEVRVWTGRKVLDYPAQTGIGVVNVARPDAMLSTHVTNLVREIGYLGAFDTDWILDPAMRRAELIDFNPRRGAQFRTFQTTQGLDVVRGIHLASTDRPLPRGEQIMGLVHTVENLAPLRGPAAFPWRYRAPGIPIEFSWYARDDMAPARAMASQMARRVARKVRQRLPGDGA